MAGVTDPARHQARIVVGVDGSAHSSAALRWALRQAVLTDARLDAVACWHRPAMVSAYVPVAPTDLDLTRPTRDATRAAVAEALTAVPEAAGVPVQIQVMEGYPARILVETARGADLLVVGSRGHGELSGMALGSVGLHCASHAPCPVLIVHEPPAAST